MKVILCSLLLLFSLGLWSCADQPAPTSPLPASDLEKRVEQLETRMAELEAKNNVYTSLPQLGVPAASQPIPGKDSLDEVVNRVKPSLVDIEANYGPRDVNVPSHGDRTASNWGWIFDSQGHIITSSQFVLEAKSLIIILADGSRHPATVAGCDPVADIAVIKIEATVMQPVTMGDPSSLKVGDWVIALRGETGGGIHASQGIFSGTGISVAVPNTSLVVNLKGETIGIAQLSKVREDSSDFTKINDISATAAGLIAK